jgi:sugar lactone lactonase YvrE
MAMVIQKWSPTGSLLATWKIAGVASVHPYPYRIAVYGIAVTRQGNMYVVDPAAGRVLQLSPGGTLLSQWGRPGHARGQLDQPVGVALDGHGHVYVADRGNNRVQEFSSGGRLIAVWGKRHAKSAPGLFVAPTSIAIDGRGRVHLADDGNRLLTLSPRGKVLDVSDFTKGSEVGDFRHPDGIAVDGQGNVYVGDKLNCRIQKLAPDGSVQVWQLAPIAGAPASPTGLAMDPQGNVYAVEVGAAIRIQLFSPTGALLREWQVP